MNRTGLVIVLGIGALAGIVFAAFPELDLAIARMFYDPVRQDFPPRFNPTLNCLRSESMWVVTALVAPAVVALVMKLLFPFTRMLMPGRAALFLIVTLALGPGLLVN